MPPPRKVPPDCPIERCVSVLAGRWKVMIVWRLLAGPLRYSAIERGVAGVSQRVLTTALAELRADGVIARDGAHWRLTEVCAGLRPALEAMFVWGERHKAASPR